MEQQDSFDAKNERVIKQYGNLLWVESTQYQHKALSLSYAEHFENLKDEEKRIQAIYEKKTFKYYLFQTK